MATFTLTASADVLIGTSAADLFIITATPLTGAATLLVDTDITQTITRVTSDK